MRGWHFLSQCEPTLIQEEGDRSLLLKKRQENAHKEIKSRAEKKSREEALWSSLPYGAG